MNKKDAIINVAAGLIHEKGYNNVGLKSILDELSIPKGSFYHYFSSKEDLGLAIIDIYIEDTRKSLNEIDPTLEGLKSFFNIFFDRLKAMSLKRGCPVGNLILELSDENERFRLRLLQWYDSLKDAIENILETASINNPTQKAKVLVSAFEGTMLLSKLDKDDIHFKLFNEITFNAIINS